MSAKQHYPFLLALTITLCCGSLSFADPPPGPTWAPIAELTDEFSGDTLDSEKWHDHNPTWNGREPVFFDPDNVALADGELVFTAPTSQAGLPEGYTHTSGYIKSKTTILYGYFEIRAKLMDSTLVSTFWFYDATPEEWTEIDIVEAPAGVDEHRRTIFTNVHVFHSPTFQGTPEDHFSDSMSWTAPFDLADDYNVYALEWDEDTLRWYVDGEVIRTRENDRWHQPLFMNIGNEANQYFGALPDDARLPATYKVQYVRAWSKTVYETWADFGYVGTESGTEAEPFNTIAEAVAAVDAGGVVHLIEDSADTTSSETPTLTKAVSIDAVGGPFQIGVPPARNMERSSGGAVEKGFVSKKR